MKYFISSITLLILMGTLGGCGGGGSSGSDTTSNNTTNTLVNIANINANGIADDLNDNTQLSHDISALFGNANAEPIAMGDDETLSKVIDRVQNASN